MPFNPDDLGRWIPALSSLKTFKIPTGETVLSADAQPKQSFTTPGSNWWTYQGNLARSGMAPGVFGANGIQAVWDRDLVATEYGNPYWMAPPVFGSGKVIVNCGLNPGTLYALSTQDGSTLWTYSEPMTNGTRVRVRQSPAVVSGRVFAGLDVWPNAGPLSGRVCALNESDGSVAWSAEIPQPVSGSVAVAHAQVYVLTGMPLALVALEQDSGSWRWSTLLNATEYTYNSPCIVGSLVVVAGQNAIYGISVIAGTIEWRTPLIAESIFPASPTIFYPTRSGRIQIICAGIVINDQTPPHDDIVSVRSLSTSGRVLWQFGSRIGFSNNHSFVLCSHQAVFVIAGDKVFALDPANGYMIWTHTLPARVESSPAIGGKFLYIVCTNEMFYTLSLANGQETSALSMAGANLSSDSGLAIDMGLLVISNAAHVKAFAG